MEISSSINRRCLTPGLKFFFYSSRVIDHFREARTENYGVAYIYFDYKERDRQRPAHVLASLVKQLARQIPTLPAEIASLYSKGKPPSVRELCTTLVSTFKLFGRVFLVFDALDECDQRAQRNELLPLFHEMGKGGASLFLTSRQYPEDIQESFHAVARVKLLAHAEDIRSYIQRKITETPRAKRLV